MSLAECERCIEGVCGTYNYRPVAGDTALPAVLNFRQEKTMENVDKVSAKHMIRRRSRGNIESYILVGLDGQSVDLDKYFGFILAVG